MPPVVNYNPTQKKTLQSIVVCCPARRALCVHRTIGAPLRIPNGPFSVKITRLGAAKEVNWRSEPQEKKTMKTKEIKTIQSFTILSYFDTITCGLHYSNAPTTQHRFLSHLCRFTWTPTALQIDLFSYGFHLTASR